MIFLNEEGKGTQIRVRFSHFTWSGKMLMSKDCHKSHSNTQSNQ